MTKYVWCARCCSDEGGGNEDPTVTRLMAEMDLELAQTELGKSFECVDSEVRQT